MRTRSKLLKRKKLFKGYCFDVTMDSVIWPNGQKLDRSLIHHPGISVIVPQLDKDHLILIRQYRYGADDFLWEVPAGTIDSKEAPLRCAKREIVEEIGYKARQWKKLTSCYASPGFNTEIIHSFLARGLEKVKADLEDDEILEPRIFSLKEVKKMLIQRKICDAKSLIALFYFFETAGKS